LGVSIGGSTRTERVEVSPWMVRLLKRVGQHRSRLDFHDLTHPETTDDRLLRATLQQMLDRPFQIIAKGLRTTGLDEVESGLRSRAARRFGGAQGLALFALNEAIRPDRSELTNVVIDAAAEALIDPNASHEEVLRHLGRAYFNAVCDDPCLTFQTFAWLAAREESDLRLAFVKLYGSLDGRVAGGLDLFLGAWGRHPLPGTTTTEIATVLTCLIEGLAMRTAVYPDSVSESLAAEATLVTLKGLTEPCDADCAHASLV